MMVGIYINDRPMKVTSGRIYHNRFCENNFRCKKKGRYFVMGDNRVVSIDWPDILEGWLHQKVQLRDRQFETVPITKIKKL